MNHKNQKNHSSDKGYKQTDIGVIPADWDVVSLSEVTSEIGDGLHSTPIYSSDGEYFFINGNNIYNGQIVITENTKAVNISEFKKHKNDLGNKTILLSINGTIGNLALFDGEKVILGKSAAYLNTKNNLEKKYIYYALQTKQTALQFNNGLTGTTIKNLGLFTIRNTKIPLPTPKSEQSAIATALSDTDALTEKLEKLIEKKKNIKQGAMQELLAGKRRLSGFGGQWNLKVLGQVLKIRHGKSQKNITAVAGKYPILATGGEIGRTNQYLYNQPSVLIGRKGTIDSPQFMDTPFWTVDTLFYTEISQENDARFIFYKFKHIDWYSYNEASGVPSLNAKTIERIETLVPPTKSEQTAIATVLSDMDTEIEKLESQFTKYQNLKQGMMQTLLTGKIRLLTKNL